MELSKILTPERIRVPLESADKTGAITELVDLLAASKGLADRDLALEAVLKREAERTTGIGYGLAIPHGKSEGCKKLVIAAGKPATPVDFQSLDGRPVTFVVLLVSPPDQTGPHQGPGQDQPADEHGGGPGGGGQGIQRPGTLRRDHRVRIRQRLDQPVALQQVAAARPLSTSRGL